MQPIITDPGGVIRFKFNAIIIFLLTEGAAGRRFNLNTIPFDVFPQEDIEQFYQLMGYSVSGYGDLSFISDESVEKADQEAAKLCQAHATTR